jgi:hypothetical protein
MYTLKSIFNIYIGTVLPRNSQHSTQQISETTDLYLFFRQYNDDVDAKNKSEEITSLEEKSNAPVRSEVRKHGMLLIDERNDSLPTQLFVLIPVCLLVPVVLLHRPVGHL